jgi:hypothetical protein
MSKVTAFSRVGCLFALFGLCAAWVQEARAQEASSPSALVESLELSIEIPMHERLAKIKRASGATLAPFVSDGCSGGLSAAWKLVASKVPAVAKMHGERPPWEKCCLVHDRAYHTGGGDSDAKASFAARRLADEELRQCVRQFGEERVETLTVEYGLGRDEVVLLYRAIADAMFLAVRVGGLPCSGLPWRWGFGWPAC